MKKDKSTKTNIKFYKEYADRYKNINLTKFDKASLYEYKKVLEQLDLKKKQNIVEFGAGLGRYSLALAKKGHHVTAVDVSMECLNILKQNAKRNKVEKNITIVCNNFSSPIYKDKFDIGFCMSTYQVIGDTEKERIKVLNNFLKSIKPGGKFLLVEPNPLNPFLYLFYLLYPGVQRSNLKHFLTSSPMRLKKVLTDLGMTIDKVNYVGFLPLRFIKRTPIVIIVNEFINNFPLLKFTSSFSYITAVKKHKQT